MFQARQALLQLAAAEAVELRLPHDWLAHAGALLRRAVHAARLHGGCFLPAWPNALLRLREVALPDVPDGSACHYPLDAVLVQPGPAQVRLRQALQVAAEVAAARLLRVQARNPAYRRVSCA